MQDFLQAYERFRTMCCVVRELVEKARFSNIPFFFPIEGGVGSVTDIVSQQTNWQGFVDLHSGGLKTSSVREGAVKLKGGGGWSMVYRRSQALGLGC